MKACTFVYAEYHFFCSRLSTVLHCADKSDIAWINLIETDVLYLILGIFFHLITPDFSVLQLASSRSLCSLIEDVQFYEEDFVEYVPTCLDMCFQTMQNVQEFDSKVNFHCFNFKFQLSRMCFSSFFFIFIIMQRSSVYRWAHSEACLFFLSLVFDFFSLYGMES